MQKKKILAMLLSAMIVMSATAVSVSADDCGQEHTPAEAWSSDAENHWKVCINEGATEGTCGAEINKGTHTGGTATCTAQAVCTTCNTAYGATADHSFEENGPTCDNCSEPNPNYVAPCTHTNTEAVSNGDGTHNVVCADDNCGATVTENVTCSGGTATCTAQAVCTTCNTAYGATADHSFEENGPTCDNCSEPNPNYVAPCEHTFTYTKNSDDSTHAKNCSKCDSEDIANETCTYTEENGTKCVCGREKASQEEPGDIQIEEVVVFVGDFIVGEELPAVDTDQKDEFTVSYTWYEEADEPIELANDSIIEAKDYKCEVVITPKSGYTLEGLTKAIVSGFSNPEHDLKVETDGTGSFCIEISKSDEPEDKPTTGGSSSSSSSSSSTTKPSVNADAEADKIKGAEAGQKVEVKIDGNTVPAAYVQAALSSKATIVVDYGTYAWEISDVKQVKAVDLSINTSARYLVEQGALKGLKGDNSNVIDIAHDGNLGFKGTLKYNVRKANAGKYVNLYFYNTKTKKLELQGSTKIGSDGYVLLPFTHCSTYVLNITATPASNELFEDFSAGESATVVEDTLPAATNAPAATEAPATTDAAANPETGNSAAALMAIPMAIAAAAIISKKR